MEDRSELPLLGFWRRCPASGAVRHVCRERAQKRRSALLTQTKSRIGFKCGMRRRLEEANWNAFVKFATAEQNADFLRALAPPGKVLCCKGKIDRSPCPNDVRRWRQRRRQRRHKWRQQRRWRRW